MDVMEQQPSAATRLTTRLLEKAALQETAIRLDPFCGMHPRPNLLDPRSPKRRLRGDIDKEDSDPREQKTIKKQKKAFLLCFF